MESVVWGDTTSGGAVRVTVESLPGGPKSEQCAFKKLDKDGKNRDVLRFDDAFLRRHKLRPAEKFTTQGLAYAAYGMDEMPVGKRHERSPRWFRPAGAKWRVQLTARPSTFDARPLSRRCYSIKPGSLCGGFATWAGSGRRPAKGSARSSIHPNSRTSEGVRWIALCKPFRAACGLPEANFRADSVASPSLGQMRRTSPTHST